MRVLITGAAGFIGSHLTDRLLADGHHVTALDLPGAALINLEAALADPPGEGSARFLPADVRDPHAAETIASAAPEVVCHLAAQVSVRRSVSDPYDDACTNVLGTANALEGARRAGARKVLFASSVAVYGVPAGLPVGAKASTDPRSPYAASKLSGELYLHTYRALHGIDSTTLVLSNVYGPRQTPHGEAGVVAIFTDALLRGEPTRVFGTGAQTRDYVYVGDVVDAFARACGDRAGGQRINVGTGAQTSDLELHRLVAEAAGIERKPATDPPRPGDLPAMAVDPAPAASELGWRPCTSLQKGIAATVEWRRAYLTG